MAAAINKKSSPKGTNGGNDEGGISPDEMTDELRVSVVMAVFDKPADVVRTIDSVLTQSGIKLEFIIVNDGAGESVVDELQKLTDPRVRVLNQTNQGLTKALIHGCNEASYEYIARIDAGDVMLENRLLTQADYLRKNPDAAMVSCWVALHTDEGYPLYDLRMSADELSDGIRATTADQFKSPIHASVMFKRSAYEQVGGYREQFYFAQDCDLWARLLRNKGDVGMIEQTLQRAIFSATGISGQYSGVQKKLAELVAKSNHLHALGSTDDSELLAQAEELRPQKTDSRVSKLSIAASNDSQFDGNYFIASILTRGQPDKALIYWRKALEERPLNLLARAKYVFCLVWQFFK